MRRIVTAIVSFVVLLLTAGWLGLQVKAKRFPIVVRGATPRMIPLPTDLPPPVLRFARAMFGDSLPEVQSAMVLGRARLAPTGLPMPTRFRFSYDAAPSSYYHDIQVTWFTLPFMRINERNLEGHTILDLGLLGRVEDAPRTNRAAIQGYWAEVLAFAPSIALTDRRVRWTSVDATIVRLYLTGFDDDEAFTVRFDAETGLMTDIETMRYQAETSPERFRWHNRILEWNLVDGQQVPVRSQTQWNDDTPWATWEVEQIVFNVDVLARFKQFGGDLA